MRPLGIYLIGIYIYNIYLYTYILDVIHFLMILGDFGMFFLNANGRTDGHTDGRTYGRKDPYIELNQWTLIINYIKIQLVTAHLIAKNSWSVEDC